MKESETVQVSVLCSAFHIASLFSLPARAVHSRDLIYEEGAQPREGFERVSYSHQIEITTPCAVRYQPKRGFSRRE